MKSPNIVFIIADDMGYGDVGCYNPESRIPTPSMDTLAAEGMRFTDAHSPSAVCTPSRYGALTGRYCWRTRLEQGVLGGYEAPLIEPARLTLASMLKQQGYATACVGKWHLGLGFQDVDGNPVQRESDVDFNKPMLGGPTELGFDYAYIHSGCGTTAPPYGFIENGRFVDAEFVQFENGAGTPSSGMMGKSWVTREADLRIAARGCRYIEEMTEQSAPFFLYLAPNAPHEPCIDEFVPTFARRRSEAGARGDLVWLFDWIVGEIAKTLEKTGQLEDTLLIVTSDNGALPGDFVRDAEGQRLEADSGKREFQYETYGHKSCGDWRGYKAHIWDGGHRIPFIARWPGRIPVGTVSDETVCLTDVMATCAAVTGFALPSTAAEDSCNVLPALLQHAPTDAEAGAPRREAIVHHSSFGAFSIRQGRWKLILDTKGSGGWPTPRDTPLQHGTAGQLYDLLADPAEADDLWDAEPAVRARLTELLEHYKRTGRSAPRGRHE